ncbi:unnamed protein product, partial [Closterium sp. NIES-54]
CPRQVRYLSLARIASWRTKFFCGTTVWVTPPCLAFVACTLVFLSLASPSLCLPCRPRLPCPASCASRGGSAPLLTPPRFPDDCSPVDSPHGRSVSSSASASARTFLSCLHSDRGGEFSSNLLRDFCRGEGILQTFTLPDSPQQNGIAERRIG